jgi:hypothetical protein
MGDAQKQLGVGERKGLDRRTLDQDRSHHGSLGS